MKHCLRFSHLTQPAGASICDIRLRDGSPPPPTIRSVELLGHNVQVPFYSCDGRMVVFGSENTNWSILATPLQSHYRERAVPGEAHSLLDGVIPGAVVAVSSSDQEPVNAVEHCYRDLALP